VVSPPKVLWGKNSVTYTYACARCRTKAERTTNVANRDLQWCDCGAPLYRDAIPEGLRIMIPARFHTNEEDMRQFVDPDPDPNARKLY
jgi:hypothetical protein